MPEHTCLNGSPFRRLAGFVAFVSAASVARPSLSGDATDFAQKVALPLGERLVGPIERGEPMGYLLVLCGMALTGVTIWGLPRIAAAIVTARRGVTPREKELEETVSKQGAEIQALRGQIRQMESRFEEQHRILLQIIPLLRREASSDIDLERLLDAFKGPPHDGFGVSSAAAE